MDNILLSIIIPVYNVEDYLHECLDSIFEQDLRDCEVICVDDESTDSSWEILQKYQDKYSSFLRIFRQTHGRQGAARNFGVKKARGEWIYFVDSDDYLTSDATSTIKQLVTKYSGIGMLLMDNIQTDGGKRLTFYPDELPLMSYSEYYEKFFTIKKFPNVVSTVGPTAYIINHKEWNNNNFYFEKNLSYEDALFLYRLVVKEGTIQIVHIDKPFYIARQHRAGSTTTDVSLQHYKDRLFIIEEAIRIFNTNGITSSIWFEPLISYYQWLILEASLKDKISELKKVASRSLLWKLRIGICNKDARKKWILAMLGVKTSSLYYTNKINSVERRLINRFFTMLDTYFPNWLIRE